MLYQKKILDAKLLEAHKKFKTNLSKLLNKENCQEIADKHDAALDESNLAHIHN